jgi:hypothetical protein
MYYLHSYKPLEGGSPAAVAGKTRMARAVHLMVITGDLKVIREGSHGQGKHLGRTGWQNYIDGLLGCRSSNRVGYVPVGLWDPAFGSPGRSGSGERPNRYLDQPEYRSESSRSVGTAAPRTCLE